MYKYSRAAGSILPLAPSGPNTGSAVFTDAIAGDSAKNPEGAAPLPSTPLLPAAAAAAAAAATTSALTVAPASMCGGGGGKGFTEVIATPPTVSSSSLAESTLEASKSPDPWPSPSKEALSSEAEIELFPTSLMALAEKRHK